MGLSRKKLIFIVAVAAVVIAVIALGPLTSSVEVNTSVVERGPLVITVPSTSTGTVKSSLEYRVSARRAGRIVKLYVEEGSRVKAGGRIADFDEKEAGMELGMREASLARAEAALAEARNSLEPLRAEAESRVIRARASLEELKNRYESLKSLNEKGYVSRIEMEAAKGRYDAAESEYGAALAGRQTITAKEEEVKMREAAYEEASSALELSRLNHEYSFMNSPIAGIVTNLPVKLGDSLPAGGLVATVTDPDTVYIESFVDEADAPLVKPGQAAVVTMDAYQGREFRGEVSMVSPVVLGGRQEARTFEVRTILHGANVELKQGMSADVEVIVETVDDALLVPGQAIIEKGGKAYVYKVSGRRAKLAEVTTGRSNWTETEITSGLSAGDRVVSSHGVEGLKDGVRISW